MSVSVNSTTVNRNILIVDDHDSIHEDFRKILSGPPVRKSRELQNLGETLFGSPGRTASPKVTYNLDSAYQGSDALEKVEAASAAEQPIALVFMDINMPPGWDGVKTAQKIWDSCPATEIVLVTAYSDYCWEDLYQNFNWTDRLLFLRKPFDSLVVKQMALMLTQRWTRDCETRQLLNNLKPC